MANPLNNATVPDNYTDAAKAEILNVFGGRGGSFNVRNQPVFYELQYGTLGDTHFTDETALQPGSGTIEAGAVGVRFRNQVAGKAATVDVLISPPGRPLLTLQSAGVVTPAMLTGVIAANGTVTAGTGFTINRTGVGTYVVTFSPAFSSLPVVLPGMAEISGAILTYIGADSVTVSGCTVILVNSAGANVDRKWNFIALVAV